MTCGNNVTHRSYPTMALSHQNLYRPFVQSFRALAQCWASTSGQIGHRLMLLRLAHFKRDFNLANTSGCLNWPT